MFTSLSRSEPELPFRGHHDAEGTQLRHNGLEGCGIGTACDQVFDSHTPLGLLKGEMAEVGKDEGQFLFVIRSPGRFPGALNEDDAQVFRIFPR